MTCFRGSTQMLNSTSMELALQIICLLYELSCDECGVFTRALYMWVHWTRMSTESTPSATRCKGSQLSNSLEQTRMHQLITEVRVVCTIHVRLGGWERRIIRVTVYGCTCFNAKCGCHCVLDICVVSFLYTCLPSRGMRLFITFKFVQLEAKQMLYM